MIEKYRFLLLLWLSISATLNSAMIVYGNFILLIPLLFDLLSIYAVHSDFIRLKQVIFSMQIIVQSVFIILECMIVKINAPDEYDENTKAGFIIEVIMGVYLFAGYLIGNIISYILMYKHVETAKELEKTFKKTVNLV
eukprot:NODE_443_length_7346_cov_1.066648.p6 type:complete len:138 gc:universal NODE_443_length_7346_cov_1.066648:4676-4263(-)